MSPKHDFRAAWHDYPRSTLYIAIVVTVVMVLQLIQLGVL